MRLLRRRARGEHGASLVEFALILPLFMMLILGVFTGGIAYNQQLGITNAAREASRFGATLPLDGTLEEADNWLDAVVDVALDAAMGDLDPGVEGRYICVALVTQSATHRRVAAGDPPSGTDCGVGDRTEPHVQVEVGRRAVIEILVSPPIRPNLRGSSVARWERG